jgi:hypothetical protein
MFLIGSLLSWAVGATQITIANSDGVNEGFNDPTPVAPVGDNPGTTLGQQRRNVFEYAARIWESIVDSNVEIVVEASFDPLSCTSTSGVLGSAGANTVHASFSGAPVANTWYPAALANSLANSDLAPADADISAAFNSSVDTDSGCLTGYSWYYGLDGNKPAATFELLSVVMHEIGHGLGFQTFVNISTGARFLSRNDAFMLKLEDHTPTPKTWDQLTNAQRVASATETGALHWNGPNVTARIGEYSGGVNSGHIRMYAPASISTGSSVSHFSNALAPNELMEPFDTGPKPGPGLAEDLLEDIGWVTFPDSRPVISMIDDGSVLQGDTLQVGFVVADNNTPLSSLALSATSSNTSLVDEAGIVFSGTGKTRMASITALPNSTGVTRIDISVSDGSSASVESFDLDVLFNNPPVVNLVSPPQDAIFITSDVISFEASASDSEDGDLSAAIQWTSSLDGNIGSGAAFGASLSEGTHTIMATATDSLGKSAADSVVINVYGNGDSDLDGMSDAWEVIHFGDLAQPGGGDFDTDGLLNVDEFGQGTDPKDGDSDNDGVSDGDEVNIYGLDPNTSNKGDIAPRNAPDGALNAGDLVVLARLVSTAIPPTALESALADINDDGNIDVADLLLLQQWLTIGVAP